jgi:2-polyprenyl-3-methyl-5-hydroxy-6-metoxy-1,4-benzoquinol methylase
MVTPQLKSAVPGPDPNRVGPANAETPDSVLELSKVRDRLYGRYRSNQTAISPDDERRQRAPYLKRLISNHFPAHKEARILDLGCGSGTLLYFLRAAGYKNISGIDTSPEQIEQARQLGIANVSHADVFTFLKTAADGSYDTVVSFDIIEHLTKPELLQFADEVYRSLAPGGVWIIHVPNAEGFLGSRVRYADLTHEQAFTPASVEQLARVAGFRSSECFEDAPVAHGLKSMARLLIWKVGRGLLRLFLMAETGDTGRNAIFSQNLLALARK